MNSIFNTLELWQELEKPHPSPFYCHRSEAFKLAWQSKVQRDYLIDLANEFAKEFKPGFYLCAMEKASNGQGRILFENRAIEHDTLIREAFTQWNIQRLSK